MWENRLRGKTFYWVETSGDTGEPNWIVPDFLYGAALLAKGVLIQTPDSGEEYEPTPTVVEIDGKYTRRKIEQIIEQLRQIGVEVITVVDDFCTIPIPLSVATKLLDEYYDIDPSEIEDE